MNQRALDLTVHFEPIVRMTDHEVVARELLVRPLGGGRLLDRAAEAGVDVSWITGFVLNTAGTMLEHASTPMHVNVSAPELARPDFIGRVTRAVPEPLLPLLVLEVTEDTPITRSSALDTTLAPLRRMGVRLAVDDFGDDYAGLASVGALQPEIIKVRLAQLHHDGQPTPVAWVLDALARDGATEIVVEQVETSSDLALVRSLGHRFAQGWYWDAAGAPPPEGA